MPTTQAQKPVSRPSTEDLINNFAKAIIAVANGKHEGWYDLAKADLEKAAAALAERIG